MLKRIRIYQSLISKKVILTKMKVVRIEKTAIKLFVHNQIMSPIQLY